MAVAAAVIESCSRNSSSTLPIYQEDNEARFMEFLKLLSLLNLNAFSMTIRWVCSNTATVLWPTAQSPAQPVSSVVCDTIRKHFDSNQGTERQRTRQSTNSLLQTSRLLGRSGEHDNFWNWGEKDRSRNQRNTNRTVSLFLEGLG